MRRSLVSINAAVDGLIARGDYRGALALPGAITPDGPDTCSSLLVEINLAEAEYNLGRWQEAWDRLRELDPLAAAFPIARAGLAQQRAWIKACQGHPDEALRHFERAELRDLPPEYHAEHGFTGALVYCCAGELKMAAYFAQLGERAAVRPSSVRNALAIHARVAFGAHDFARAERLLRQFAQHPYRGQGGDALLLWGATLELLDRQAEARKAYELAALRDPQSESAEQAQARMARLG